MKTMCPPDYHHKGNGFVATHALEDMYIVYPKA